VIDKDRDISSLSGLADAAFEAAAAKVVRRARQTGTDILVWKDNAIVKMTPEEFERTQPTGSNDELDK
jgi:hypothetical protein